MRALCGVYFFMPVTFTNVVVLSLWLVTIALTNRKWRSPHYRVMPGPPHTRSLAATPATASRM